MTTKPTLNAELESLPDELREPVRAFLLLNGAATALGISAVSESLLAANRYDALIDEVANLAASVAMLNGRALDTPGLRDAYTDAVKVRTELRALETTLPRLVEIVREAQELHDALGPIEDAAIAHEHGHAVDDELEVEDVSPRVVSDLCSLVCIDVPEVLAASWSASDRQSVANYAGALHLRASDNDDVEIPDPPSVLVAIEEETRTLDGSSALSRSPLPAGSPGRSLEDES